MYIYIRLIPGLPPAPLPPAVVDDDCCAASWTAAAGCWTAGCWTAGKLGPTKKLWGAGTLGKLVFWDNWSNIISISFTPNVLIIVSGKLGIPIPVINDTFWATVNLLYQLVIMKSVSNLPSKSTVKFLILSSDNPANILFNLVSSNFVLSIGNNISNWTIDNLLKKSEFKEVNSGTKFTVLWTSANIKLLDKFLTIVASIVLSWSTV